MIDVKNLHKYFGSLEVLKGIDCHIDKGECVCVIGPSGSGKSTFLRCLNLLETPTKGDIVIDDMHLTEKNFDVDAMRKRVGMVFQHFNLFNNKHSLEPLHHLLTTKIFIFFPSHSHTPTLSIVIERRYASSHHN